MALIRNALHIKDTYLPPIAGGFAWAGTFCELKLKMGFSSHYLCDNLLQLVLVLGRDSCGASNFKSMKGRGINET